MKDKFLITRCKREIKQLSDISFLNFDEAKKVQAFHSSFKEYEETPLANLSHTGKFLGVEDIWVKDESYRFGLNAFKVLGGSFAIGNYIANLLKEDISRLDYEKLISEDIKAKIGDITFITATDGNHGRGVAWTANKLRQKSIVYMPKGSAKERLENIRKEGAKASITELNYDQAVRLANDEANEFGYVMVQDTAWDGYEDIPTWIMKGYMTMAFEALKQLKEIRPTHVFLQAGVGSLAGAVTGFFANVYKDEKPTIVIVEPNKADCIYQTAKASDGTLHFVTDDMATIMAGLACGEPNTIGWKILRDYADFFISCPDEIAAKGMRMLASPLKGDDKVVSGESGAVTFGALAEILGNAELKGVKEALRLDNNSKVLCFSTEGDTDKARYLDIVWDGLYPSKNK